METKMLEQLAHVVLPKEILERFLIVKIETDEADIDAMSMTIHLDERINKAYLHISILETSFLLYLFHHHVPRYRDTFSALIVMSYNRFLRAKPFVYDEGCCTSSKLH